MAKRLDHMQDRIVETSACTMVDVRVGSCKAAKAQLITHMSQCMTGPTASYPSSYDKAAVHC